MNLDDFSTVVDEQRYINPQVALDESDAFIQNLRDVQQSHNAEIAQDTYNLGTAVPSNIGGLGGSGSYFNARYQTPQTNTMVADLRATAQAQALNDAMSNALAQAKERYNKAYKNYTKRHSGGGSGSGYPTTTNGGVEPDVNYNPYDGTPPTNPGNPNASDYISSGYQFYNEGNLPGQTGKFPLTVDTPNTSTSYRDRQKSGNAIKDARDWVDYLHSIGWKG